VILTWIPEFEAYARKLAAENQVPPQDVANVARRVGVMLRGRWLPESELRDMLERLAASYVEPLPQE